MVGSLSQSFPLGFAVGAERRVCRPNKEMEGRATQTKGNRMDEVEPLKRSTLERPTGRIVLVSVGI